jgi:hypothetical protein
MIEPPAAPPPGKAARNEQRKAFAATCNAVAISVLVYAVFQPVMSGHGSLVSLAGASLAFVVLQAVLHYILKQVED